MISPMSTTPDVSHPCTDSSASNTLNFCQPDARTARIVDFKCASEAAWLELIRDLVALANSGGGKLLVQSARDHGDEEAGALMCLTADSVRQKLAHFTGSSFADFQFSEHNSSSQSEKEIRVAAADFPIGFVRTTGNAEHAGNTDQVEMPVAGSFYFRHGDRSEPGTTADLQAFFLRLLRRVRRRWLRRIRQAVSEPTAAARTAAPSKRKSLERIKVERAYLQPVRIVTDPNAPALQPQDVDRLYPWRQKDLVRELNSRLGRRFLNSYDIQAVRRQHRLDERPDFVFNLPGAGRRYSPAVAEWVLDQYARDPNFFHQTRAADHEMLRLRRQKPK
jgi:hypothetical protein